METYRKLFDAPAVGIDAAAIIAAYRKLLAELIADYRTSIAPSSFRVSASANTVRGRTPSAILASAEANPCGVSLDCQFAPVFGADRMKHEAITTAMSNNYDAYREKVVLPLFRELKVRRRDEQNQVQEADEALQKTLRAETESAGAMLRRAFRGFIITAIAIVAGLAGLLLCTQLIQAIQILTTWPTWLQGIGWLALGACKLAHARQARWWKDFRVDDRGIGHVSAVGHTNTR
ncbi:MAG TPA: hypothetical protein PK867_23715 [Pirellulales bacterium]|nr:hypothetical protein [Pirellulales bacterium]